MNRLLQFTLDLFERDPAPAAAPEPTKRRAAPPRRPKAALTPDPQLFEPPRPKATTPGPVGPPAAPLTEVIAPMSFRHPQANRELQLQGTWVAYRFERARRRSIGFVVGPEGLVVRAPRWVPQAEVDAALRTKSAWIVRKLDEARERQTRQAEANVA